MFLLGQWRNYDELEEWLTLNELVETYNTITERENRNMEFQARVAGAEIKSDSGKQQAEGTESSLTERLRKRSQEKREQKQQSGEASDEFSYGVGYMTIGG